MIAEGQLGLLGLAMRAGKVVVGTGGVRAALQQDEVALVVVAADCSERTRTKVVRLAEAKGVPMVTGPVADALGRRLGRSAVQAVGVCDARLAAGIATEHGRAQARRT